MFEKVDISAALHSEESSRVAVGSSVPQQMASHRVQKPPIRATFLTLLPSPYTQDLLSAMRQDGRIEPHVLYQTARVPGFDWGTPRLSDWETILPRATFISPGQRVTNALARAPADVYVVGGYSSLTMQTAMRWLHRRECPWVFFGERPAMKRRGPAGTFLRSLAMRPAVQWPDGIAAVGESAVDAYRQHARRKVTVCNLPYFCDLAAFQQRPASPGGVPGRFRMLFCGQLIERKGLLPLFDAFARVAGRIPAAELVLAGDGHLRHSLRERLAPDVLARVRFEGFRPIRELPSLFATADAFVLPSLHDGWGVVVNQALGAGLPVVASDAVGAALDLVRHGENGWIVPAGDVAALERALSTLSENPSLCRQMGRRASETAHSISLQSGVQRWYEFLSEIVARKTRA